MNRPTTSEQETAKTVRAAAVIFGAMIAFQMAGKATQNTLFLTTFRVSKLPIAMIGAAALTIVAVTLASHLMSRFGPGRVVTAFFLASGVLQLVEWALIAVSPNIVAVAIYLHYSALGALLISGFWSVISERFDPHTLKRAIGPIGTAGAVGGLLGALTTLGSSDVFPVAAMLPILASLHLFCGIALRRVYDGPHAGARQPVQTTPPSRALATLTATPYMRTLIAVVLVATVSEGLLDFVFKARADATFEHGPELLRLFALFYLSVGILSFLVQTGLSRRALERLGLARTAGALPLTAVIGSVAALAAPGLPSALFARGAEMVSRNTLYRAAYELLFTPMRATDKRAVKPLVDVGVVRVGDAIAGGLIWVVLQFLTAESGLSVVLALAMVCAIAGIALTIRLNAGYIATLERSLLSRAVQIELEDVTDSTTRSALMRTIAEIARVGAPDRSSKAVPRLSTPIALDATRTRAERLRSRDPAIVNAALTEGPLDSSLIPSVIALLPWDDVAATALHALQDAAADHTGLLVASLLDSNEDFAIRRRLPAALLRAPSAQTVEGLVAGLADSRFEVRFRCGRALARLLSDDSSLSVKEDRIHAAVLREVAVERRIWESQRLLDRADEDDLQAGFVDEALRMRASRSLEHVFTLLSLVMPAQPLRIAFRGLYADDPLLRGTALEYLEIAMPAVVRDKLWPFLDDRPRHASHPSRSREEILASLLASHDSVLLHLDTPRPTTSD